MKISFGFILELSLVFIKKKLFLNYKDKSLDKYSSKMAKKTTELTEEKLIEIANSETINKDIMSSYDVLVNMGKRKLEEGKKEGLAIATIQTMLNGRKNNLDISLIANIASISEEEVIRILKENGLNYK